MNSVKCNTVSDKMLPLVKYTKQTCIEEGCFWKHILFSSEFNYLKVMFMKNAMAFI